jgi:hypothetical protein
LSSLSTRGIVPDPLQAIEAGSAGAAQQPCPSERKTTPTIGRRFGIGEINELVGWKSWRNDNVEQAPLALKDNAGSTADGLLAAIGSIHKPNPTGLFGNDCDRGPRQKRHRPGGVERRNRLDREWWA